MIRPSISCSSAMRRGLLVALVERGEPRLRVVGPDPARGEQRADRGAAA